MAQSVLSLHLLRGTLMVAALLPLPGAVFLSAKPALPLTLVAQASANFTVSFQASTTGGYSAALSSDGLSVLLTAAVEPGLTYEVQTASGMQPLAASPIDFGSVQVGQTRSRHAVVTNRMQQTPNFSCDGCRDRRFQPARSTARRYIPTTGQRSGFDVQFLLSGTGLRTASLTVGSRIYTLTGTGVRPPMSKPRLTISLPSAQSAQQGTVSVNSTRRRR